MKKHSVMIPIKHQYHFPKLMLLYTNFFNVLGIICLLFSILFPLVAIIVNHETLDLGSLFGVICNGILYSMIFLITGNFFTEVTSDAEGLHLIFLWRKIDVPWEDVKAIKPVFNIKLLRKNISVVRTRSLTIFHLLYGLLYSFNLSPSIIIYRGMKEYDELVKRMEYHIRKNQRNLK